MRRLGEVLSNCAVAQGMGFMDRIPIAELGAKRNLAGAPLNLIESASTGFMDRKVRIPVDADSINDVVFVIT